MPQVNVMISGRTYRMACGEGEEAHLEALATQFDAKISELRQAFGEIGDMRLHVMAAITMADELSEARRRMAVLTAELERLRGEAAAAEARASEAEAQATEAVARTAERIERLARGFGAVHGPKPAVAEG